MKKFSVNVAVTYYLKFMSDLPLISYRVIFPYYANKKPVFQSGSSVSNIHEKKKRKKGKTSHKNPKLVTQMGKVSVKYL